MDVSKPSAALKAANPIYQIRAKRKPFVYYHTHVIDRSTMDEAVRAKKSLEIDVSIAPDGSIYVGHPLPMYEFFNMPPPNNLPLDTVLAEAAAANLFIMFDCKDVRVLPRVEEAARAYGVERCMIHAFVKELVFKPYSSKIVVEPHWDDEQLPINDVLNLKDRLGLPVAVACRGLSYELLAAQGEESVLAKILKVAEGRADVVVPALPKGEPVAISLMNSLLEHDILPLFNVDTMPEENFPALYLGSTDNLTRASLDLHE